MAKVLVRTIRKIATEIALIGVVSAILVFALKYVHRLMNPSPPAVQMKGPLVTVGSRLRISAIEFSNRPLTLLLVSSPYCHFCLASKSFHNRLFTQGEREGIPVFLAVPERSSSEAYSSEFHLPPGRLKEWKEMPVSVEGTPTLLAINSSGIVSQLWIGQLTSEEESSVLDLLRRFAERLSCRTKKRSVISTKPSVAQANGSLFVKSLATKALPTSER